MRNNASSRMGGLALTVGAIFLLAGNILHPRESFVGEGIIPTTADSLAALFAATATQWYASHVVILAVAPLILIGCAVLAGVFGERGDRVYGLPMVVTIGTWGVLQSIAVVIDGFVIPVLVQHYGSVTVARPTAGAILEFAGLVRLVFLAPAFLALAIGMVLLGVALAGARLYPRAFAWAGIALAVAGIGAYVAGAFGPYWVTTPLFAPYAIAFTVWFLVLGVFLYRTRSAAPEAHITPVAAAHAPTA